MRTRQIFASIMITGVLIASGAAVAQGRSPSEAVAYRQEQMKRVGATFKRVSDGLRQPAPDVTAVQNDARALADLARDMPNWFAADTAPPAGQANKAKAEIWSDAAGFAQQVATFQGATQNLANAADAAQMRTQFRAVAPLCSRCHDAYSNH